MKDAVSIKRVNLLHPAIRTEVAQIIGFLEVNVFPETAQIRIVQGLRTFEEQNGLYALGRSIVNPDGRTKKRPMGNIVTQAKAGQSYHCYGLAVDVALMYDKDGNGTYEKLSWDILADFDKDGEKDWMEVVDKFQELKYDWGGLWSKHPDNPHLEKRFGYHWTELLKKYNNKEFIDGTNYVLI